MSEFPMHPVPKRDPAHPVMGCVGGCMAHLLVYCVIAILGVVVLMFIFVGEGLSNPSLQHFILLMGFALIGHSAGSIVAGWVYFWATRSMKGIHWLIIAIILPVVTFNPGDKVLDRQDQGNPSPMPLWLGVLLTLLFIVAPSVCVPLGARLKERRSLS